LIRSVIGSGHSVPTHQENNKNFVILDEIIGFWNYVGQQPLVKNTERF